MTELPACCCRYGSPSSTTLVYRCFSPATQHVPWWVHHTGHPRLFSRSAQSFTPDPPRESTLGQLGKSYKKKKEKYRIRQVCTLATLGQKQQPRSGLARFPRRVSLWPQALWGVSHAWPDAARLAASVSVPHCLSLGVGRTSLQSDHVASVYGLQWHKGNRSPSARVCLRSPAVPMTLGSSKSIHVELTTASNPSL